MAATTVTGMDNDNRKHVCMAKGQGELEEPDAALIDAPGESTTGSRESIKASQFSTRRVASTFIAPEQRENEGTTIRRSLGSQQLPSLDPFLMLDDIDMGLPGGFPDHPHRGLETVTYLLPTSKGSMRHESFLGNRGELRPGDLQWLTAGSGMLHAEMPANEERTHGLQLWINLPKTNKTMKPRYQEIRREDGTHVWDETKKVEAIVFAGEVFGHKGPAQSLSPVSFIHFRLRQGADLKHKIPVGHNAFIYALTGAGTCAGETIVGHQATVLEMEGDGVHVRTEDARGLEFIFVSGQPLNEPVAKHGPFAMNTETEIHQTFSDYQLGKNGFENAPTWVSDIGGRRLF
ncbi:hypothetical protein BBJ28_00001987 [Nothophytophthora sp. Chile5]|nr:hypothetical protein BBJ28_00001987 [Nothophytophthora sp. Chile5]